MQPKAPKYLFDIQEAAGRLIVFTSTKTLADYRADVMLQSAVERQFEIIGEAISQLLKLEPALEHQLTNPRRIIGFRNILIHTYWAVSHEVVWGILERDLPILQREVSALLEAEGLAN